MNREAEVAGRMEEEPEEQVEEGWMKVGKQRVGMEEEEEVVACMTMAEAAVGVEQVVGRMKMVLEMQGKGEGGIKTPELELVEEEEEGEGEAKQGKVGAMKEREERRTTC